MNVTNMLGMIYPRGSGLCVHSCALGYYHYTSKQDGTLELK